MNNLSRRGFLWSVAGTATFAVTVSTAPQLLAQDADVSAKGLPILRFNEDGKAILGVPVPDMGQGMITTAAQIVAEELDLSLEDVSVELMPFVGKFNAEGKAQFGHLHQGTGGSLATAEVWVPLRQAAAYMRQLLLNAAVQTTGLSVSHFETENGQVVYKKDGTRIPYAQLAEKISSVANPDFSNVQTKDRRTYKLVGKEQRNVAATDIVSGKPLYGIDQDIPDMLHAVIRRCPHLKGDLVSHNGSSILTMPGVRDIIEMPRLPEDISADRLTAAGVAVVADSYWAARKAADALQVVWDGSHAKDTDTELLRNAAALALDNADMETTITEGDFKAAIENAKTNLTATYHVPNWAHACLEPHSCIADIRPGSGEIWCGHQFMDVAINGAAEATGLPANKINAHFFRIGTGFGRKFERDYIQEACFLSQKLGKPVKVTWSREDEMEQDFVNHLVSYRIHGGVNSSGQLDAMHVRVAAAGNFSSGSREIPAGLVDNYIGEWIKLNSAISNGAWRGPGSNTRAWATLSFLDELAHKAGIDPFDFLVALFNSKPSVEMQNWPNLTLDLRRHVALLEKVAAKADYGKNLPEGRGQGIAIFQTHHSLCAHVVDVSMHGEKDFRVERVTSAIDCGLAVNPLGIKAQVESGIIDGLCAAKYGNMIFERGVPVTNNFDTYRKLRMAEAPMEIDIHIVDFGDTTPRGTGETSLPPFIPALTNAIFAASGKRIRTLPISKNL